MLPIGEPTPEGIISAIGTAFRFYEEAKNAVEKFETAKNILESLDLTLCTLEKLTAGDDAEPAMKRQVEVARSAWRDVHSYSEKEFPPESASSTDQGNYIQLVLRGTLQHNNVDYDGKNILAVNAGAPEPGAE